MVEFGPEWGQVEFREEENYYFQAQSAQRMAASIISSNRNRRSRFPIFVRRNCEMRSSKLSGDLCISRPKSRLDWGIELPFDKDFVNLRLVRRADELHQFRRLRSEDRQLTKQQPQEFRDQWPALQIIGKDILVPAHGIYWLIMLHAIGFPD